MSSKVIIPGGPAVCIVSAARVRINCSFSPTGGLCVHGRTGL